MPWGSWNNRQRVGVNESKNRQPTQSNPTFVQTWEIKQQTDYSTFNFDGHVTWSGIRSGSHTGRLNDDNVLIHATVTRTFEAWYSGSREVTINISGTTDGTSGTATLSENTLIPRRPTGKPSKPGRPSVSNIGSDSAKFTWSAPSSWKGCDLNYYQIQVATGSDSFGNPPFVETSNNRSITISGLPKNHTCWVRVRARANGWDSNYWTDWSNDRQFTTDYDAPGPCGGRTINNKTSSGGNISWNAPDNGGKSISKYEYEVREGNSTNSRGGPVRASEANDNDPDDTNTTAVFNGLDRYTQYQFWCRAYNGKWGPWQDQATNWGSKPFQTNAEPPVLADYEVKSVARTSATIGNTTIADNGGQGPNNYRCQYNTSQSTSGAQVETSGSYSDVQLSGLTPLTTYYFRCAAANATGGWGGYGPWRSFTTNDTSPDEPNAPVVVGSPSEHDVYLTWDEPALNAAELIGYEIRISEFGEGSGSASVVSSVSAEDRAEVVDGLLEGVHYEARVRALANPSNSGFSPPTAFYTAGIQERVFLWLNIDGIEYPCEPWFRRPDTDTWELVQPWFNDDGEWKAGRSG